jgi:hypothetical protein
VLDNAKVRNARCKFSAPVRRCVAAAIVDEDEFIVDMQSLCDVRDFFDRSDDVGFFVIGRKTIDS